MNDPDDILRALFEKECRSRSADPQLEIKARRPANPAWRPAGTAAAAAGLLAVITLGFQYSGPSEMDRLIAGSLPAEESLVRMMEAGSEIVVTVLEGRVDR